VARFLADENVPIAVVEALRAYGHDVATLGDLLGTGLTDPAVLDLGREQRRAIITLNRRDFFRLHREHDDHEGIIACTFDPDFAGQAERVHAAVPPDRSLRGVLVRVNRPAR
jgi:predicted nuclease of predicted toxin-antitoxin system